jgi:hypothetical protein
MEFLKSNLWEIRKSSVLQIFGGLLALAHLLTYIYWAKSGNLPLYYHANPQPMCWTMFETCGWVKFLTPALMEFAFHAYGVVAGLVALLFFFTRLTATAWIFSLALVLIKAILYIQDLRLTGNVHYLLFVLNFCFLFVPAKPNVLRWVLVSYYVASGLLRLSPNWLSGQQFVDQLAVPIKLGEWLAAMAVLLELLAPVALWFRDLRNFLIAYFALILYHAFMWYTGGFLEPAIMLMLLQIFPLLYYEERKIEREYLYQSFIRPEPSKAWVWLTLGIFWAIQSLPYIPHTAIPSLKHLETNLALAPVAASEECIQTTFMIYENHMEEVDLEPPADRPTAFRCNPYLRFLDIKAACHEKREEPNFKTMMSYFQVRGLNDKTYRTAFQSQDLCAENVTFQTLVGANDGI